MYGARTASIVSISVSAWIFKSIGLDKSRLKIPMIDFASITYLPDTRSKSTSNFVTAESRMMMENAATPRTSMV